MTEYTDRIFSRHLGNDRWLWIIPPRDPKADRGARVIYSNGVEVTHGGPTGSTFIGTSGCISVDRNRLTSIPEEILKDPLKDEDVHLPSAKDHHANCTRCVIEDAQPQHQCAADCVEWGPSAEQSSQTSVRRSRCLASEGIGETRSRPSTAKVR